VEKARYARSLALRSDTLAERPSLKAHEHTGYQKSALASPQNPAQPRDYSGDTSSSTAHHASRFDGKRKPCPAQGAPTHARPRRRAKTRSPDELFPAHMNSTYVSAWKKRG
jgi:hypothetical protein